MKQKPRQATELTEAQQLQLKILLDDKRQLENQRDQQLTTLNTTVGALNYNASLIERLTNPPVTETSSPSAKS